MPVLITEVDDLKSLEFAIIENVQRQDLNAIEEAKGYQRLIDDFKYDQESSYFRTHYNLKSISPLLYGAGVVVASFGNLSYEALAHKAPLCLVGTKKFQARYGEFLVKEKLAYNAGLINKYDPKSVLFAIKQTINE